MKPIIIIIAFIVLFSCQEAPVAPENKLFDPNDLPLLALENLENFWGDNSSINVTMDFDDSKALEYRDGASEFWEDSKIDYRSSFSSGFDSCSSYLDQIKLSNNKNEISVTVFTSQTAALECMYAFIKKENEENAKLLNLIFDGFYPEISFNKNKWWLLFPFCDENFKTIWVNNKNTIIYVNIGDKVNTSGRVIAVSTATEILHRIDFLTN